MISFIVIFALGAAGIIAFRGSKPGFRKARYRCYHCGKKTANHDVCPVCRVKGY